MKQYICTGTWRRNNKGDIISEQEYNKMPIEAKLNNYKEYSTLSKNEEFPLITGENATSRSILLEFSDEVKEELPQITPPQINPEKKTLTNLKKVAKNPPPTDFDEIVYKNQIVDIDFLLKDE